MAAPSILGTTCTTNSGTTITVTLPSWTAGDLALVFLGSDMFGSGGTWSALTGWTQVSYQNNSAAQGDIRYRIMQAGDSNPTFTFSTTRAQAAIAVIIDDGTFDSGDVVDVNTAATSWNSGADAAPTATAVTTNTDEALAFATFGADGHRTPFQPASTWTETHSADCGTTSSVFSCHKEITTAASTGDVAMSMGAGDQWVAGIVAIKPASGAPPAGGPTNNSLSLMGAGI